MAKGGRHAYGSGPPGGRTGKTTTMAQRILAIIERSVPEFRLNRPEKKNALTPAL